MKTTHFLSLAAASALASTAAFATPSINFYGDLDASVNHTDLDFVPVPGSDPVTFQANTGTSVDMESFESKIGVTGGERLGDGMRAFYRAEFGIDATDDGNVGSSNHERYVGLVTSHGKVRIGTIASPHDDVVNVTDKFNNKHAVNRYSLLPNLRTNNTVRFDGGNEDGLSYSVAVTAGGTIGSTSPGVTPFGNGTSVIADNDQEADLWTLAVKHSSGNITAGFAHTSVRGGDAGQSTLALNGLGVTLDLDMADLALTYEVATQDHNSVDNIYLSGTMALCEKTDLTAGYGIKSVDDAQEQSSFALGAHRALSANTVAYVEYAAVSTKANSDANTANNQRWANVGIRHTFGDNGRAVVRAK